MSIQVPQKMTKHAELELQRRHFPSQHVNTACSVTNVILYVGHSARQYLISTSPDPGKGGGRLSVRAVQYLSRWKPEQS